MPTLSYNTIRCAVCGRESRQPNILSYSTFGFPDLDFRPPKMLRDTMSCWIQDCPFCCYSNTELSRPCDLPPEVFLEIYQEIETGFDWKKLPDKLTEALRSSQFVSLKRLHGSDDISDRYINSTLWEYNEGIRFAKLGAMLAKLNDYSGAATQFLMTAWSFDDEAVEQAATHWRKKAIEQVETMINQSPAQITEEMFCIYADMLRRTGDFQSVINLDERRLHDAIHIQLMKYQKELSELSDHTVHRINESGAVVSDKYSTGMFFCL